MPNMLDVGSAWLERMREKHATMDVEYVRGGETFSLRATVGKTVFQVSREYGLFERTESRDYIVDSARLILAGAVTLPKKGDRVRETDGAKAFIYEVMAPGMEPCWRYSDLQRRALRIHTKLVAQEG
jgi:hypothetical protein